VKINFISRYDRVKIAEFMSNLNPDLWNLDNALEQLQNRAGWYLVSKNSQLTGWLLCEYHKRYQAVEIVNLGYDFKGKMIINEKLIPLIKTCENYALEKGVSSIFIIFDSTNFSCHGQKIEEHWMELKNLQIKNNKILDLFLARHYRPHCIFPNTFGPLHHGIVLLKQLE